MSILDRLRRLDAYPKTLEEYRDKTIGGAAVTVTSAVLMILLLLSEVNNYLQPNISEDLFVDTTRSHKLKINLDLTIPRISCNYLSLDAMDSAGDQHLHIDHNIYKRRLDLEGNPIEEAKKEEILTSSTTKENVTESTSLDVIKCGSCYGAQVNETHCCNTCQDVIDAYREKKWNPNTDDFEQCKNERYSDKSSEKLALKEGCQIYGHLEVNRMGGSFHVAPGKSFSLNHIHIHDVHPYSSTTFNTSHTITHLSFGERIQAATANTHPLDSTNVYAKEGAMMFQYYIKIVPTVYEKLNGELTYTNQFSVTRHSKSVSVISGESGMPGIFYSYELSPLMVKYTEKQNSLGHFATNVCAIVGGIFTVAGIIDSIFHHSIYLIKKKIELGKLS